MTNLISSGLLLLGGGSIFYTLKDIPAKIFSAFKDLFTVQLRIRSIDLAYNHFYNWLAAQPSNNTYRNIRAELDIVNIKTNAYLLFPSTGYHWIKYKGKRIHLYVDDGFNTDSKDILPKPRTVWLYSIGRSRKLLEELMLEIGEFNLPDKDKVRIYCFNFGWFPIQKEAKRYRNTLVLQEGTYEETSEEIKKYLVEEKQYNIKGIPYKLGYLLHGIPGSGKSSLIHVLASELNLPIYSLSLGSLNNESLMPAINTIPKHAIVVIEDIDCIFDKRRNLVGHLGFDVLLNSLDGIVGMKGKILFITTNNIEKLDPALIRTGRCDKKIEFTYATSKQIERIYLNYYPGQNIKAKEFAQRYEDRNMSMSDIQAVLSNPNTIELNNKYKEATNE